MKQVILILFCSFFINSHDCFSQIETKIKHVCGYSNDLNGVTLGITFGKTDTAYYIRFRLALPASEYRQIYLSRKSTLTFLSKSGKTVDLKLAGVSSSIERYRQVNDTKIFFTQDEFTTTLTIPVTREQLVEIGSEPFHRITLPYFENPSKSDELTFTKPALLVKRNFTQVGVKYILAYK